MGSQRQATQQLGNPSPYVMDINLDFLKPLYELVQNEEVQKKLDETATLSKESELEVVATALPHPATGLLHPTMEPPHRATEPLPTDVATSPTTSRALQTCSNRLPRSRAPPTTTVLSEKEL